MTLRGHGSALQLLRPFNFVMFWIGVALGGLLTAGLGAFQGGNLRLLLIAAASASLIGGGANAINDVFDLDIDRVNRPQRPLPSGRSTVSTARMLWAAASIVGVALSFLLTTAHVVIAAVSVALCYLYSARLKRVPVAGNLLVAFVTPLALIVYGGWAVGPPGPAFVGAAFAFLTTFAREVVKDIEDVAGDAGAGARTIPLRWGVPAAVRSTAAVLACTVALTPLPFLVLEYSGMFLLVVLVADVLMLSALWMILRDDPVAHAGKASSMLKTAMLVGIAALAFS